MSSDLTLILFDCDGTLVDSQYSIAAAMTAAFLAQGLPAPAPETVRHVVGLSLDESVRRLAPDLPPRSVPAVVAAYRQAFSGLYGEDAARDPLYPGVRDAIAALEAQGCLLGIATGKSRGGVTTLLRGHGLLDSFVTFQTPDTNPGKPHPGMVESALAATGAERTRTCLIGDSVYDMQMAVNAGIAAIGVDWGYHDAEALRDAGATHLVRDFSALPPLIGALYPVQP